MAVGIPYRSQPHGADACQINALVGGRLVYWSDPGWHVWEMLTVGADENLTSMPSEPVRV